ncbi:MAG: serine/threonine-protein phosphatase [Clostridia bacterium]|nr:serine/threonine-protein phosphatase [Clostridia bacterium]
MLTYSLDDVCTAYIVLDGIGGATGGEIASKVAGEKTIEYLKEHFVISKDDGYLADNTENISMSVKYANRCVYELNKKNKSYKDMGTTIAMIVVQGNTGYIVNVGDSRIYELKEDKIVQLSEDDTYVNALVRDGIITEEEAKTHPDKHVLLKALGVTKSITFNVRKLDNVIGRKFLLCSDGLTIGVEDSEIFKIAKNSNSEEVCSNLIKKANENGGLDNITVMYVEA